MDNYETIRTIGEGTYGVVVKARHRETGQIVAIKKFKESDEDEQVRKTSLREVRVLKQLRHDNIINLLEVFRRKGKLYLVFEYAETTILELLEKHPEGLHEEDVRKYTYQLLRGVEYCHAHGIVHRDIKPENILISRHGALKLCDFGFARLLSGPGAQYTDYVATRWYRSPELLVGDTEYGKAVDIWAIGCIFAEVSNGLPLFPGESDVDQLFHIIKCFGKLTPRQQAIFRRNPLYYGIELPNPVELDTLEKRLSAHGDHRWLLVLKCCLSNDPGHRNSCTELLCAAYFAHQGFAEKYEEELKGIMEKDAAANLMRLKRQKQRRPRSDSKRQKEQGHRGVATSGEGDPPDVSRSGEGHPAEQRPAPAAWGAPPLHGGSVPRAPSLAAAAAARQRNPGSYDEPSGLGRLPPWEDAQGGHDLAGLRGLPDLNCTPRLVPAVYGFPSQGAAGPAPCPPTESGREGGMEMQAPPGPAREGGLPTLAADPPLRKKKKKHDKHSKHHGESLGAQGGAPSASGGIDWQPPAPEAPARGGSQLAHQWQPEHPEGEHPHAPAPPGHWVPREVHTSEGPRKGSLRALR
eukprot:TRINITY_DN3170_c0_g1_i1.p1 TRINITY_DN3170_c0_g1~~TRINITY_DN3170_c0_g1_i1.p1  ORF type:complete len:578 (+),score=177.38 TRINITY_DN3170_c0_g1_i1:237-1970(+)